MTPEFDTLPLYSVNSVIRRGVMGSLETSRTFPTSYVTQNSELLSFFDGIIMLAVGLVLTVTVYIVKYSLI
jgi:hypothetical protein